MSAQTKSQTVGSFITAIFVCFLLIGVILGMTYHTTDRSVFNPLPYSLGSVYDVDTLQRLDTHHANVDVNADANRT